MKKTILAAGAAILAISGVAYAAAPGDRNADMTLADAQAKSAEMFDRMDVNDDGKIDAADKQAKIAERFAKLDTNSDGSLSLEEFSVRPDRPERGERMGMRGPGGEPGERGPGGERGKRGHHGKRGGMQMIKMADANSDGAVTKAEFDAAFTQHFSMMDANGDGTVTAEERKAMRDQMRAAHGAKTDD